MLDSSRSTYSTASSTGVLATSASLETALTTQFQADGVPTAALQVQAINEAPAAVTIGDGLVRGSAADDL